MSSFDIMHLAIFLNIKTVLYIYSLLSRLVQELVEELKMPSDAQLMQSAIRDLNNSSLSLEDHHRALHELLVLVEPIDNANGLLLFAYNFL